MAFHTEDVGITAVQYPAVGATRHQLRAHARADWRTWAEGDREIGSARPRRAHGTERRDSRNLPSRLKSPAARRLRAMRRARFARVSICAPSLVSRLSTRVLRDSKRARLDVRR